MLCLREVEGVSQCQDDFNLKKLSALSVKIRKKTEKLVSLQSARPKAWRVKAADNLTIKINNGFARRVGLLI